MHDIELPIGKRSWKYRLFEMLPAICSYTALGLLVVLSLWNAIAASIYLLAIIITVLVRAVAIAWHTIHGYGRLQVAHKVDWRARLHELENAPKSLKGWQGRTSNEFGFKLHLRNLKTISDNPEIFPKPSQLKHAVIVAAYNESIDVIEPTIQSLADTTIDSKQLIIAFAYEERGGEGIAKTAKILKEKYGAQFGEFYTVMHPKDLPGEVVGKGGNITFAGRRG